MYHALVVAQCCDGYDATFLVWDCRSQVVGEDGFDVAKFPYVFPITSYYL